MSAQNGIGTMSQSSVKVRQENVTPKVAERLLNANQRNRNLRPRRVTALAGAMQRGEWELNGESIKVAEDGSLIDGQHRLAAVMASGVTVPMIVVRGLPSQVLATIDTGAARSIGDTLKLNGEKDYYVLAAALRRLWMYEQSGNFARSSSVMPTPQQILGTLDRHPQIRSSIPFSGRLYQYVRIPKGPFAAMHYLFSLVDAADANVWFTSVANGDGLPHDDPRAQWRNQTLRWLQSPRHPKQVQLAAWAIKSWNLWRAGERLAQIQWHPQRGEKFPLIDGLEIGSQAAENRELVPA
jgi:hypothetical protein